MTAPESPLDPAELSAYLDGELPAARAAVVEARLAQDGALRAEYEALRRLDGRARESAAGALFVPTVRLPPAQPSSARIGGLAAIVLALAVLRLGSRFVEPLGPSLLLNLVALAVVAWAVLRLAAAEASEGRP